MIDRETLAEMRLQAAMCDDYTQYREEMDEICRLEAELSEEEAIRSPFPCLELPKRPTGGIQCRTVEDALQALDKFFNQRIEEVAA